MHVFWGITAVIAGLALAAGIVYLIHDELREHRRRQAIHRLRSAEIRHRITGDYSRFDQEQILRNRSENWDGR